MKVRIKDIAARAGVSPATVSLVLNGRPGISRETREQVMLVAEELGYRQQGQAASGTRHRTTHFLKIAKHGHTVNRDHDVFIADYIDGLAREAQRLSYRVEIQMLDNATADACLEYARQVKTDGLVLLGTELNARDLEVFCAPDLPEMVFLDTYHDYLPLNFVDMNNTDAVFEAVGHFHERGHRSIGMLQSTSDVENFRLRDRAFAQAMAHYDLPAPRAALFRVDSTFEGARRDMERHLKKGRRPPPALFAANDIIAYGCMRALQDGGHRIPDDVSVIGFDDLPMSAVMDVPLTTIRVSKREIGRTALRLLADRINAPQPPPPSKILVGGQLIVRSSVRSG